MLRKLLGLIGVSTLLIGAPIGAASAADMPLKAPPLASEYDWTGFYVGENSGWEWQHHSWAYSPPIVGAANQSWTADSTSSTLGGQIGLQKQWNHIVFGVETAFNTDVFNKAWDGHICPNTALSCQTRANDILTVGGRLGYAGHSNLPFLHDWLLYGDGGWARGTVETNVVIVASGSPTGETTTNKQNGWYGGVGVETLLYKGTFADWISGIDYRHVDLGTAFGCTPTTCGTVSVLNRNVGATADIFTFRVSLKMRP
jgi:outer membrane immunogenic protein